MFSNTWVEAFLRRQLQLLPATPAKNSRSNAEDSIQCVELEPRILYSATPIDIASVDQHDANLDFDAELLFHETAYLDWIGQIAEAETPSDRLLSPSHQANEIVFVSDSVGEYQDLIDSISDDPSRIVDVFVLDSQQDGVEAISQTLANYHNLQAIHFVTHGASGQLELGNLLLNNSNLSAYAGQIATWNNALDSEADLLIYGCDLASTRDGQTLAESLSELCGCDVAASDDLTGHSSLGGDWILEYAVGDVTTEFVFNEDIQHDWMHVLSATETGSIIDANTFTNDTQETTHTGGKSVATNDAGNSVVVWQGKKQDVPGAGDYGVFAQILDINGNPIGTEIAVNDHVLKDQMSPSVAMADDGSFVIVWASEDQDGDGFGVFGTRFDALGNKLDVPGQPVGTHEFQINVHFTGDQLDPAIAIDATGNFVVTWTSNDDQAGANSKSDIFYRRYDSAGNSLDATDILVNSQISFDQYDSSVDMSDAGQFVVSWTANGNQDGDGLGVYAQKFAADGTSIGSEILVNSETSDDQYDASVAIDGSGGFVVVFTAKNHPLGTGNEVIIAQLFNTGNTKIGDEILVSAGLESFVNLAPSVDMTDNGQFVVTWTNDNTNQIFYQEFSAAGTAQDQLLLVDTSDTVDQFDSSVALRNNGDFIVAWKGAGDPAYDDAGVFAQRFSFDNAAPDIDLPGAPITYYENDPPIVIDLAAVVGDADSSDFLGGRLVIDFLAGGTANDRLAIRNQGVLTGEIGISGSNISYGGVAIGTFSGGVASSPLVITLNANATVAATEALAQNITFENLPNDPDTSDRTVRFVLHDGDGGTSDPATKIISITQVNDAPVIQGITTKVITEDVKIQFQNADLISITDVDAETSELRVTLSVTHGVINLNTTNNLTFFEGTLDGEARLVFSGTLTAINNALNNMEYVPTHLYVGTDQLIVHVDDQGNTGAGGSKTDDHVVDITINPDSVNDAPINIKPANETIIEDEQLVFSAATGNRIWIQDDSGAAIIRLTLEITKAGLPSTDGVLTLSDTTSLTFNQGDGIADSRMVINGALEDINNALDGMVFEPDSGFTGQLKISIFTEDLGSQGTGGAKTDLDEVRVDILERNDPPVISAPDTATTTEGVQLVFDVSQPINIVDPDATGDIQVTLDVSNGIISLGSTAGLNFVTGANHTASITIKGNQAEIDAALNNLKYTPNAGYAGPDNLQITVNDLGGVGAGGAQVDAETIEITVTPDGFNADPVNSIPSTQSTDEETPLELSTRNGNKISITDDAGNDLIKVTLEVNDGTLTLSNTVGTEFDVNNFVAGDQEVPQVAIDQNGNYVVVWQSNGQDGGGRGIYAQLFNANGIKTGSEFLINQNTAGDQTEPAVSMDKNGNFVVAWTGLGDNGATSKAVYARLFDIHGNDLGGGEILVNETTPGEQTTPSVAMNWQTGDFVVTWQSKDQIDEWDIFARQFSFDLATIGNEFQVNNSTLKKQTDPSIDINDSGDYIIGWETAILGDDNLEVMYRRFDWSTGAIDATDQTANDNSTKNQENAAVAINNAGNFVVAWQSKDQDYGDDKYGIYAQIWDNTGSEIRNEFRINDTLPMDQLNPSISMADNGDFIIGWQSHSTNSEIYAKRFDITGNPEGDEFLVNLTSVKDQANPDVALNRNGDFVVAWQSEDQDGFGQGVFGQQFKNISKLSFIEGDGVDDARIVFEGTLRQINDALDGLIYAPNKDFVGNDTLSLTTNDQHATDPKSDVDSFDINVGPINDAPVITSPGLQIIPQDGSLTFDAGSNEISISDVDAGTVVQSVTMVGNHGIITLINIGGLASLNGNGTDLVTLSGTLSDINAALNGMQFDPTSGFAGSASIFLRVDDPGESLPGDELSAAQTVFIQIDPDGFNGAPEIELPGPQRTDKNVELFLDSESANLISINDDAGIGIIEVSLTVANGTITLSDGATGDINEYIVQTGNQTNPAVGAFADGSYVLVWESPGQDGNGTGIVGQRFSSGGFAMGDEFIVNSFVTGNQLEASIATSSNGNFVVTWQSPQDGGGLGVYGQLFDNFGFAIGDEFIINTTTASDQHFVDVAMADDGSFVAVWQSGGDLDGNGEGIFAQRFDANGVTLGDEFSVTTTIIGNQTAPAIAMSGASGDFVVVWQSADNNMNGIFAQRFDRDGGAIGNQFLVNTTALNEQISPDVAMDDTGNFVVTWESVNEDGFGRTVAARLYNNLGQPQGSGFIVNDFVAGDQEAPAVAMNSGTGEFVIIWQSANQDGDGDAIVGQRFDANAVQVGSEFVVNSNPAGDQTSPAVAMNSAGEIIAAFVGDDAAQDGVFVKKILPNNAIQFVAGDGIHDTFVTIRGTLDDVNAALNGLRFDPNIDFEGIASISISVNDLGNSGGSPLSDSETLHIAVGDALLVDLDADNSSAGGAAFETNFVPGGGPVAIADSDVVIDDPSKTTMQSMTITIANLQDGADEILAVNVSGTLISVNSFVGGVLSLSGVDSIAHYELVLSRITYDNTSTSPTIGHRFIDVVVNNGTHNSNVVQTTIFYLSGPTDITTDTFAVDENIDTSTGLSVGTLLTADPDLPAETFTYTILAGADGVFFSIGGINNDELILTDGVLDFESRNSYTVNVEVKDSTGNSYSESLTVNVSDLNEIPIVDDQDFLIDENSGNGMIVGSISAVDPDAGVNGNLSYSVTGGTGTSAFNVDSAGQITVADSSLLDFESTTSFTLNILVIDGGTPGLTDTSIVTINLSDVNEAPTVSLTNLVNNLTEDADTTAAIRVADIVINDDALGTNNLTLSGADAADFEIVGNELRLKAGTTLDFETKTTFDVTVEVDDTGVGSSPDDTAAHTISITDVNETPNVSLTNLVNNLTEDTDTTAAIRVADIVVNDDALGMNNLTLSGSDAANFEIVGNELRLKAGTTLDFESKTTFDVTVEVDDTGVGATPDDTAAHTLSITDINEAPTVSLTNLVNNLTEDTDTTAAIRIADIVINDDALGTNNLSLSGADGASFEIVGNELRLKAGNTLDFESKTTFDVTVEIDDTSVGATPDDTAAHTLSITDINEAPTVLLTNLVSILTEDTDTTAAIRVADIVVNDDALGMNNLTLSGSDAANFEIVGNELRLKAGTTLDFESKTTFDVTVEVDDTGVGATPDDTAAHTLSITDINEAPTVSLTNLVNNLTEDTDTTAAIRIADIVINDDALGTNNLSLSGADGASFEIVGNELRLKAGNTLDFESKTTFDVTVEIDDTSVGATPDDTAAHTLSITDINEAPTVSLTNLVNILTEDTDTTAAIRIADIVINDDALGTNNLTLSGADAAEFEIVGNQLRLKAGTTLDFETKTTFEVTVEVDDMGVGTNPDDTAAHTVNVSDTNEAPTISNQTFSVNENAINGTIVGNIAASDFDAGINGNLNFSLTGGTGLTAFAVDSAGQITVSDSSQLDFESTTSFTLIIQVTDGGSPGLTDTATITINVNDLNEAPVILSDGGGSAASISISENTTAVTTVVATDVDTPGDTLTYSIAGGADASSFAINAMTGVVTFASAPDFEAPTDSDFDNEYEVDILVVDGKGGSDVQLITVSVLDGNEIPTTSGIPDLTVNEDPFFDPVVYNLHFAFSDLEDPDSMLTYTIVGNTDPSLFDSLLITPADFIVVDFAADQNGVSDITVRATDTGGLFVETTFRITINPVNDDPFVANPVTPIVVNEDAVDTLIDLSGVFDDVDILTNGDVLSYSLVSNTDPTLVATNLVGSNFTLDFQDNQFGTATIVVRATDLAGKSVTETINITVNPVNDDPVINNQSFDVDENTVNGTSLGFITAAPGPGDATGGDSITDFTVTGGTGAGVFMVDSMTGEITVMDASALNFESAAAFTLEIQVTDNGTPGLTDTATITINLNDLNETPLVNDQSFPIAENATNGMIVGNIAASDFDAGLNGNLTFVATGGTGTTAFDVDSSGQITVADASLLDFEATPSFTLDIEVTDGGGLKNTATVTINLNDVNETPTLSLINLVNNLNEDTDTSSAIRVADIVINDDALGTNNLTLSGADAADFEIVGNELRLKAGITLNFESKTTFDVTVEVDDTGVGATPDDTATHAINITDINEAPTVSLTNLVSNLTEDTNTSSSIRVADIIISDDALGTNVLSLSGADAGNFEIVGSELRLKAGAVLDFEAKPSFDVTVEVDDSAVGSSPDDVVDFNLSVKDVNEAPKVSLANLVGVLPEDIDTTTAIRVADIVISDDALGTNNLTIGGTDAASFEIVGSELRLKAGVALDFETKTSFEVRVEVDDSAVGLTPDDSAIHTLGITDANDAPVLLTNQLVISEGQTVVLSSANLIATDVDDPDPSLIFQVSNLSGGRFALVSVRERRFIRSPRPRSSRGKLSLWMTAMNWGPATM